jgi:GAF domain-containing protein
MSRERVLEVLGGLADLRGAGAAAELCRLCAAAGAADGASIVVSGEEGRYAGLCASDPLAARIDELQRTLGVGPGLDAHRLGIPVSASDLAVEPSARWPEFAAGAVHAGARAVFSFPLRSGGARLGSLTFHRRAPAPMLDEEHADALLISDLVVHAVLALQAGAPPGTLAAELEVLGSAHAEIHQAAGMVSVQLGVSVAEALVRLRAHAYAVDSPLAATAREVVMRRLRLGR